MVPQHSQMRLLPEDLLLLCALAALIPRARAAEPPPSAAATFVRVDDAARPDALTAEGDDAARPDTTNTGADADDADDDAWQRVMAQAARLNDLSLFSIGASFLRCSLGCPSSPFFFASIAHAFVESPWRRAFVAIAIAVAVACHGASSS